MTPALLETYRAFLEHCGYCVQISGTDSLQLQLRICDQMLSTDCRFPSEFPYIFPEIRLLPESMTQCSGIPHRFVEGNLCLFDPAEAQPNFLQPKQVLLAAVKQAEKVLTDGLSGKNQEDFQKEILAYWSRPDNFELRYFDTFPEQACRIVTAFLPVEGIGGYWIAARKKEKAQELWRRLSHNPKVPLSLHGGIYIPLTTCIDTTVICNEHDMWSAVAAGIDPSQKRQVSSLLKDWTDGFVLVSVPAGDGKQATIGWQSAKTKPMNGFRRGKVSPLIYWQLQNPEQLPPLRRANVTLCSQERLFHRGSDGYERRFRSAAIVGCGAVGGQLAQMLSSMGTEEFFLIDYETLSADNIARHICGYGFIGCPKAQCVEILLTHHNPNIRCTAIKEDAFVALDKHLLKINEADCLFVAVGELPLEAYIMKLAEEGRLHVPIALTWVEPHCYAAHMIYIRHPENIFSVLVDAQTMTYRYSVLASGSFVEHEPGCQTGYIPYSGLDVQQYLSRCLHELSFIRGDAALDGNYHFIWIGELSEARRQGIAINPPFQSEEDFRFIVKRL